MNIQFTTHTFKEGNQYVAYTPELDLSSCGGTAHKASENLVEAVRLFLPPAGPTKAIGVYNLRLQCSSVEDPDTGHHETHQPE